MLLLVVLVTAAVVRPSAVTADATGVEPLVVEYPASQLLPGRFAGEVDADEVATRGYLETAADGGYSYGDAGGVRLTDPLPPGRYRATFQLGAVPDVALPPNLVCQADVPGHAATTRRVTATEFPPEGFIGRSVTFAIGPASATNVDLRPRWSGVPTEPAAVRLAGVRLERLTGPVFIASVRPDKVLYWPQEAGQLLVEVCNGTDEPIDVALHLERQTLLSTDESLGEHALRLAPRERRVVRLAFNAGDTSFGQRFSASLYHHDERLDRDSDVASVATNLWDVAMGEVNNGILHNTRPYKDEVVDQLVERARGHYSNWIEKHFWAPDDWGNLTPWRSEWISGQAARYENRDRLKLLIARAQAQGIRAITYGKGLAGGPSGFDLARRKPEWFLKSDQGVPVGRSTDAWDVDHWDDVAFHLANRDRFLVNWFYRVPDLRQLEVLDHGIDELIASAQQFGWDGVRFDGHFSAGNDAMSTRNMQRMKRRLLEAHPRYVFGYNIGGPEQFIDGIPHEVREAAAGGGHWMNEAIGQWAYAGGRRYERWRHFAETEHANAQVVRDLGASYHWIYRLERATPVQATYKFVIGTIVGAHPVYGGHAMAGGIDNWGRFLTRWSLLVWHPHLQNLAAEEAAVQVRGRAEGWDSLDKQVVLNANRRLQVMHVINPPPGELIHEPPSASPTARLTPMNGLRARYQPTPGETLQGLYWIEAGASEAVPLALDHHNEVTLPPVRLWAMLVADLSGHYDVPPARPTFTEAPDPAAVAAAMEAPGKVSAVDPLRPHEQGHVQPEARLRKNPAFNLWSVKQSPRRDLEARDGKAASYDHAMGGGVIGAFFGELRPGRYRATVRIKTINPSPETRIALRAYSDHNFDHPQVQLHASEFANHYQSATIEVRHLRQEQLLHVFISGAVHSEGEVVLCDDVRLKLIEPYTDDTLATLLPPVEPLTAIGPPHRVLVLYGHYHQFLRLPEVIERLHPGAEVTDAAWRDRPTGPDDIAPYGTVVIANLPALSYPARVGLRDFVHQGGHLIVFGGQETLSQGGWNHTYLADLLPVTLHPAPDVIRLAPPASLTIDGNGAPVGSPQVLYAHRVTPRPGATVHWRAGGIPVLTQHQVGSGRVTLFSGCVLGEPDADAVGFWQWSSWVDQLVHALRP